MPEDHGHRGDPAQGFTMNESIAAPTDDLVARTLATRLRVAAGQVTEPQRSRILNTLPETLFISHTSLDDAFIKGAEGDEFPRQGSIWWICGDRFPDSFYHSRRTGAADSYERTVGLALLASTRVLVIWSQNALRSDYVRAELLIARARKKKLAAYIVPSAPVFPLDGVPLIYDLQSLRAFLRAW